MGAKMTHLTPENVPEEDFTTITDINDTFELFSDGKISLAELDRLKDKYYVWYYSPQRYTTTLRFYRQPDGTMTIYEQIYVQTYGESGNPDTVSGEDIARQLDVHYDGAQEGIGMQFTDIHQTGTTFYANTLEEARTRLAEKRELFADASAPTGTCYRDAWRYVMHHVEAQPVLVHGTAISISTTPPGGRIGHAWVELSDGTIWEPYSGAIMTIEKFYSLVDAIAEDRYTADESARMLSVGKHGPWSAEERMKYIGR